MFNTSSYSKYSKSLSGRHIGISNTLPLKCKAKGLEATECGFIIPSFALVKKYHAKMITAEYFVIEYTKQLDDNREAILSYLSSLFESGDNITFYCYEVTGFCHRHVFSNWVKQHSKLDITEN